ncbi:MAG: tetratricopeptide repeat protein [candidate division Zixibacteria bacterium]|nr:tetratricopeptide repeat protein [candidate division Zixibacteria bacterium]
MKIIKLAVYIVLAGIMFFACDSPRKAPEKIEFINNFTAAKEIASKNKQPMVVEFYTKNCPWSKMLDDSTYTNSIVIKMSLDMVFVKINVEKDSLLAKNFGVSFYPTIILFLSNGAEVDRLVGYYPPCDFFNEIQLYLQGSETLEDYLVRLADEPDKIEYHLIVAEKYRNRSDWDLAIEYYSHVVRLSPEDNFNVENATLEIAGIYAEKKEYSKAIESYNDFISRFPDSDKIEDAIRRIPYCYKKKGDDKKAMELFEKYLYDYPNGKYAEWVANRIEELQKVLKEGI